MHPDESERLWTLVRALLRQPAAADDAEARRALNMLTAARPDAAYLLLQRALVLELALERIRSAQVPAADIDAPAAREAPSTPAPAARPGRRASPFVRDAAVIAAGVVGGGLMLGALNVLGEQLAGDDGADGLDGVDGAGADWL